jgi:hypothetical protein
MSNIRASSQASLSKNRPVNRVSSKIQQSYKYVKFVTSLINDALNFTARRFVGNLQESGSFSISGVQNASDVYSNSLAFYVPQQCVQLTSVFGAVLNSRCKVDGCFETARFIGNILYENV